MQRQTRGSRRTEWLLGCFAIFGIITSACPGSDANGGNSNGSAFGAAGAPADAPSAAAGALGGTSPLDPNDVENDSDPDLQPRALEISSADVASSARWKQAATVTSLRGEVLDAVSGMPVTGEVHTTAECAGCMLSADKRAYMAPIKAGAFTFSGTLTLNPASAFTIYATGYRDITVAHGPKVPVEGETINRSATELPTLYVCAQDAADTDDDGICDAAEQRYGTKPDTQDSDGDSLSDTLELYGHPYSGTGAYYDIWSLGADPLHRDIFLAIRFTQKSQLNRMAFPLVRQAFDKAPSTNPDGKTGIHLHILFDDRAISGNDDLADLNPVWTAFDQLEPAYFGERPYAFHHVLWANTYNGSRSSGVSRDWGAADLVVSLGSFANHGTVLEQAGTLMHELGHNLGLHHNGYTDESYVPHYMSIMSYAYQMTGIERSGGSGLDYAGIEIAPFNEGAIDETAPFAPAGTTTTDILKTYLNPRIVARRKRQDTEIPRLNGNLGGQLDFDGDGKFTKNAKVDLNRESAMQPEFFDRYPATRNDWASIEYGGGPTGRVGDMFSTIKKRMVVKDFQEMPPCFQPIEGSATAGATMSTPATTPGTPASGSSTPATNPSASSATPSKPASTPTQPATTPNKPATEPNKPAKDPSSSSADKGSGDETLGDASTPDGDASALDADASVPDGGPEGEGAKDAAAAEPDAAVAEPDAAVAEPETDPGEEPATVADAAIDDPSAESGDEVTDPGVPEEEPDAQNADSAESDSDGQASETRANDDLEPEEQPDAGAGVSEPDEGIW